MSFSFWLPERWENTPKWIKDWLWLPWAFSAEGSKKVNGIPPCSFLVECLKMCSVPGYKCLYTRIGCTHLSLDCAPGAHACFCHAVFQACFKEGWGKARQSVSIMASLKFPLAFSTCLFRNLYTIAIRANKDNLRFQWSSLMLSLKV